MKIHVVLDDKHAIDGFVCVNISSSIEPLKAVISNSCTSILAIDILDKFPLEEALDILNLIISKMRLGGEMILRGVGLTQLGHAICLGSVSSQDASIVIRNNKSLQDTRDLCRLLESQQLVIDSLKLNGISYEIIATRNPGTV